MTSSANLSAKPVHNATSLQILANALEVESILVQAARLANELLVIAGRSQVIRRHILNDKPTRILMTASNSARSEEILGQLKELSERYTERVRKPAAHVHRNQDKKFLLAATALTDANPTKALAKIAKFMSYRERFLKEDSEPIDFRAFIPGAVEIVKAAIEAMKKKSHEVARAAIWSEARGRKELDIDAAARVVENEANTSGIIGQAPANALSTTVANGAHFGAVAGVAARTAMKDVDDGEKIRTHDTPFDTLKTMKPS